MKSRKLKPAVKRRAKPHPSVRARGAKRKTKAGPKNMYEISVERNPTRKKRTKRKTAKRKNSPADFALAGRISRQIASLEKKSQTAAVKAQIKKLQGYLEKVYARAYAAERAQDRSILEAPRSFSTKKRVGGGVRKKKANPRKRKPVKVARKNSVKSTIKKVVKTVKRVFKKKNDGSADREEFAGKVSGFKDLYFPPGTPHGLSTLGPLDSFTTTHRGKITFPKGQAVLCQDSSHNLYVGSTKPDAALYSNGGPLRNADLGKIKQVEYVCAKPHLGKQYASKTQPWFHDFESPLPHLRTDEEGRPIIEGGSYTIEREGITG